MEACWFGYSVARWGQCTRIQAPMYCFSPLAGCYCVGSFEAFGSCTFVQELCGTVGQASWNRSGLAVAFPGEAFALQVKRLEAASLLWGTVKVWRCGKLGYRLGMKSSHFFTFFFQSHSVWTSWSRDQQNYIFMTHKLGNEGRISCSEHVLYD